MQKMDFLHRFFNGNLIEKRKTERFWLYMFTFLRILWEKRKDCKAVKIGESAVRGGDARQKKKQIFWLMLKKKLKKIKVNMLVKENGI